MKRKHAAGLPLLLGLSLLMTACGASSGPRTAAIVQDGAVIRRVDLDAVTETEDVTVPYGAHSNTIRIAPGEIRMLSADCPDQICVHQRNISKNGETIICLPNKVVVTVCSGESSHLDGITN